MKKVIYLDNAATTKVRPEVVEAMLPFYTEYYGNPSAVYEFSTPCKEALAKARETVANSLGAKDNEIYFTNGGSESDNWALIATAEAYASKGQLIDTDQVVEYNFYNGNYYGTLREEVDKRLEAGKLVVLVIDVHGAANIRRMFPGATTVFLLPPSVEELEHRLRGRGTETEESIRERLATAQSELAEQDKFTLKLVNNEVASCAEELYQVICRRAGIAQ